MSKTCVTLKPLRDSLPACFDPQFLHSKMVAEQPACMSTSHVPQVLGTLEGEMIRALEGDGSVGAGVRTYGFARGLRGRSLPPSSGARSRFAYKVRTVRGTRNVDGHAACLTLILHGGGLGRGVDM